MSWSGGAANRSWQRGRRGTDDGRLALQSDIAAILAKFRAEHDWLPGMVWDPRTGLYVSPLSPACIPAGQAVNERGHPPVPAVPARKET